MSEENVARTHRFLVAFNDRDLDRMAAEVEDDSEFYPLRARLEDKRYVGPDGLREMLDDFDEDWEYLRLEVEELRDTDDVVVALCRMRARGLASQIDFEVPMAFLCRFDEGRLVSSRTYTEHDEALRAAGLD